MSKMEPETKTFLNRIVVSLALFLIWFILNMTIGIYLEWFFIYEGIRTGNIIAWAFLLVSLLVLIRLLTRIWRRKFPHG